ncbi:hypothetical protein D3C81_1864590 [compost metagenome]
MLGHEFEVATGRSQCLMHPFRSIHCGGGANLTGDQYHIGPLGHVLHNPLTHDAPTRHVVCRYEWHSRGSALHTAVNCDYRNLLIQHIIDNRCERGDIVRSQYNCLSTLCERVLDIGTLFGR